MVETTRSECGPCSWVTRQSAARERHADRSHRSSNAPRQSGARRKRLRELTAPGLPIILFEAPTRVERLLADISDVLPDATITLGREITKLHEEWLRGTPDDIVQRLNPRGEFVLVVEPRLVSAQPQDLLDDTLRDALTSGATLREAVDRAIAATGMPRKQVYARALEMAKGA